MTTIIIKHCNGTIPIIRNDDLGHTATSIRTKNASINDKNMCCNTYTVLHKKGVTILRVIYLCQILTDFQNSFTG